jgi:stress response protein YsnF
MPFVAAGWLASTLLSSVLGRRRYRRDHRRVNGRWDPEDDARAYAESVRRGGTLVTVRTEPRLVDKVVGILDDDGTVDMENRVKSWQKEGWTGRYAGASTSSVRPEQSGSIPVIEEELKVGKSQVAAGRVRIHSHVVEQPVQKQVSLTDERVRVERRPVDRPATSADRLMQDRTIEATERREEAVDSKEASVKEEVRLSKEVDRRSQAMEAAGAEEKGQIKAGVGPFLERMQRERQAFVYRREFPTRGDKSVRARSRSEAGWHWTDFTFRRPSIWQRCDLNCFPSLRASTPTSWMRLD